MIGVIKKLLLIFITLILFISCKGELQSFKTDSFAYSNNFTKGPVSLEMKVDNLEINTAGNIKVFLEGNAADGWKPSFPDIPENLDKFTVLNVSDTDPRINEDGSIGISRIIVLKPFLSGNYDIPSLLLNYSNKDNNTGTLLSTPVTINVISLLPEDTANLELKGIREPDTFNYRNMFLYIFIAVIFLGGVILLVLLIRKRKREKIIPGIPPFEEAYNKLDLLISKNLPREGRFKEFYFQLNLIVRIYIEKQFAIRAPEQTTEEFLQDLAVSNKISDEYKVRLRKFLIHSDLVKFARHKPAGMEITESIESCKNFIRATGEIL